MPPMQHGCVRAGPMLGLAAKRVRAFGSNCKLLSETVSFAGINCFKTETLPLDAYWST